MSAVIDKTLAPLDDLRRTLLRGVLQVRALRAAVVRRETRVPLLVLSYASLALVVALLAPCWALVVSPLVLGVPHVAADVRYLVLRRRLPRVACVVVLGFAGAMLCLRALHESGALRAEPLRTEHAVGVCWLLLGAIAGIAPRPWTLRSAVVAAGALGVAFPALAFPETFRYALMHGHNLVALLLWCTLFRRSVRLAPLVLLVVLAVALLLASGVLLPITLRYGVLSIAGLHLFQAADWIAPGAGDVRGVSLTIAFAFLQSVHYAIWLVAIPQSDSCAAGPPTLRMKARGLERDFGPIGAWLVLAAFLVVAAAGAYDPLQTRNVYLSLASFHSWLELALLAYLGARAPVSSA